MLGNSPSPVSMPTSFGAPASIVGHSEFYVHQSTGSSADDSCVRIDKAHNDPLETRVAEPSEYFRIKTLVDRSITAVLMIVALPLMVLVGIAVLVCDGRPIFFRQVRVGKSGRTVRIWKFRTMQRGAERRTGAVWSSASDSRVTKLGRWLRCSHLDELPQFINVLAGDMNLVGPRPERPEFVEPLTEQVPGYMKRTQVRPGITGLAQLRLGYDESFAGIPEKVDCDLDYICQASWTGDLRLLASTLPYIVRQIHYKWSSARRHGVTERSHAVPESKQKSGSAKPCSACPTS